MTQALSGEEEVVKIKTWLKMGIPKLQLNLDPIIAAPAAKGNVSTRPHCSLHLWGLGCGDTLEANLSSSDRVSRSFVPLSDKVYFVCKMHFLPLAMLVSVLVYAVNYQYNLKMAKQNSSLKLNALVEQKTFIQNYPANVKSFF